MVDAASQIRFKDAPFFKNVDKINVLVVGAGGIGSWTTLLLTRAGFNVTLVDFDTVSAENFAGQLFFKSNVTYFKTDAVSNVCKNFVEFPKLRIVSRPFIQENYSSDYSIIISAVDTVPARKTLFEFYMNKCYHNSLYIDTRLGAEFFEIKTLMDNSFNSEKVKNYINNLELLSQLPDDVCTYKQTSHIAAMCSSFVTNLVINYASIYHFIESEDFNEEFEVYQQLFRIEDIRYDSKLLKFETW